MLAFPRELIWLTGAPGAGKGTHIATILKERDLVHTVEVSSLLTGPTFEAIKASGRLVSDSDVVHAVLRVLLDPKHAAGVVLDGFANRFKVEPGVKGEQLIFGRDRGHCRMRRDGLQRNPVVLIPVAEISAQHRIGSSRQHERGCWRR